MHNKFKPGFLSNVENAADLKRMTDQCSPDFLPPARQISLLTPSGKIVLPFLPWHLQN